MRSAALRAFDAAKQAFVYLRERFFCRAAQARREKAKLNALRPIGRKQVRVFRLKAQIEPAPIPREPVNRIGPTLFHGSSNFFRARSACSRVSWRETIVRP